MYVKKHSNQADIGCYGPERFEFRDVPSMRARGNAPLSANLSAGPSDSLDAATSSMATECGDSSKDAFVTTFCKRKKKVLHLLFDSILEDFIKAIIYVSPKVAILIH